MTHSAVIQKADEPWSLLSTAMLTPEGIQNPYPYLERLHDHGTHFHTPDGSVAVYGYRELSEMVRSRHFFKRTETVPQPLFASETPEELAELRHVAELEAPLLVFLNQPDHGRIRDVAKVGFMPSHLATLRLFISDLIDRLLADIDPKQPCDLISRFSALFAPEVMAELIGLPDSERALIVTQTGRLMRGIDPGASFEVRLDAARARHEQCNYVRKIIADRRASPRDDFVTRLVQANDQQGAMSDLELTSLVQILYIGGYETTSHMIGNGVVAFMTQREQWELLCADVTRARDAVEEMLRFDGPISLAIHIAAEGAQIGNEVIAPGTVCFGVLAAANHDPAVFPEPFKFDITRPRSSHVAFSGGPHFCLGSALARLELEIVFTEFARRFPNMQLAQAPDSLRRVDAFHQRAYESVSVVLEP